MKSQPRIWSFNLHCGDCLAGKYQVVTLLGAGWEGEVYLVRERGTGIERTVKIFFDSEILVTVPCVFMQGSYINCDTVLW